MKALRGVLIALVVLMALGLGAVAGGYYLFRQSHVKIDGEVYDLRATEVDRRGMETSVALYKEIKDAIPAALVHWDVPFQDAAYPEDTTELTVTHLSQEDLETLHYLPNLTKINGRECRDYDALLALEQQRPDCQVDFAIHLGDMALERDTDTLILGPENATQQLPEVMPYLPKLTSVELADPAIPASELYALQEAYPNVTFTWTKDYMGKTYGMDVTELDFSNQELGDLQELENAMAYLPNLQKLILVECGFDYEDLAAYRDRVRDQYKVVWGVHIGKGYIRTDATSYMPSLHHKQIYDEDTYNLRYCEDLIAVDFGHINVGETSWCVGTPHLKYLILGDGNVFNQHVKPLSGLQELEYLELFNAPVTDISPLTECKALKDLLLSGCFIDTEPLKQMTWLDNLWLLNSGVKYQEGEDLRAALPDTHIEIAGTRHGHSRGWRDLPNYFAMRDVFGMGYMKG